jgi:hypothetical protein
MRIQNHEVIALDIFHLFLVFWKSLTSGLPRYASAERVPSRDVTRLADRNCQDR